MSKEKKHERMKFIDENSSIHTTEELIASRFYLMGLEYALEEIEKSLMSNTEADIESFDNIDGDYFNTHERSIAMNNFKDGLYLQRNRIQTAISKLKKG